MITTISITSKKIKKLVQMFEKKEEEILEGEDFFLTFNQELFPKPLKFDKMVPN